MTTYHIKYTSRLVAGLFMLTFIILLFVCLMRFVSKEYVNYSNWLFLLSFAGLFLLLLKLSLRIATVMVLFEIDNNYLTIKNANNSGLNRSLNYEIDLTEIETYSYERGRQFDAFIVTMKNKESIRFFHNTDYDNSDDFTTFLSTFENLVSQINQTTSQTNNLSDIIRKKTTIYEKPIGILIAVFATLAIVTTLTLMIWNKNSDLSGYGPMTASLSWAVFYLTEFYRIRGKGSH